MEEKQNYRLYRNLYDIIHPTISRKNISNYEIVLDGNLMPLKIFYPDKSVDMKKVIIYTSSDIKNEETYSDIAKRSENVVLVIYGKNKSDFEKYYNTIKYIYDNIDEIGINNSNVTLMTDHDGLTNLKKLVNKFNDDNYKVNKIIVMAPNSDAEVFNKNAKVLIIKEDNDFVEKNEKYKYVENLDIDFFLNDGLATKEYVYSLINEFLEG